MEEESRGGAEARRLTKGQRKFFDAVAADQFGLFHRTAIEPIEGLPYGKPGGLVRWTGGPRLVGCNSFSTRNFSLTHEGEELLRASAPPRET